jgi:hypothetical protein
VAVAWVNGSAIVIVIKPLIGISDTLPERCRKLHLSPLVLFK